MVSGIKKIAAKTDDRELQGALRELVSSIDDAAKRVSDPRAVALMKKADEGYAMVYRVEDAAKRRGGDLGSFTARSEEHTSGTPVTNAHLVCRLLLEKKKTT